MSMATLADLAARGYVVDEWARWQQGGCLAYAVALQRLNPELRFGTLYAGGLEMHHVAHDDRYAYDSAGRHPLPYLGVHGDADEAGLDESAEWYDEVHEEDVMAAMAHAQRHHILGLSV